MGVAAFVLLIGSENASPWKETDKLRVEVTRSFVATDTSPELPCRRRGVIGLVGVAGRLRSTDWDRLGTVEGKGVDEGVELMERDRRGEGHLLDEDEEEVEVEVEVDGEGDMYLEETCLPLGLLGRVPLSFSEGNSGGLDGFWWVEEALVLSGPVEAASEMAATIIRL